MIQKTPELRKKKTLAMARKSEKKVYLVRMRSKKSTLNLS